MLNYTAGHPIAELANQLPSVIQGFEEFIPTESPPPNEAYTLDITQLEAYVYVMWLLALCKLLGHAELIPTVLSWLDRRAEWNRGRDAIFEQIVKKLTGDMVDAGRQALHIEAYRPLGHAILAEDPANRPALVKEFVEGWYKHMKDCYWHGTHSEGSVSYFGYWSLEAALVTYLWDIDDSSYRDHLVYPKDLVDFARGLPSSTPQTPRCPGGEACPRTGWWHTPQQRICAATSTRATPCPISKAAAMATPTGCGMRIRIARGCKP